ncbi:MAG: single-stranded-DNA-specific exonuclease RecJ [Halorhodospira sp.]
MTQQIIAQRSDFDELSVTRLKHAGIHPLLARAYARRGIRRPEQVEYEVNKLPTPEGLPGVVTAAERLFLSILREERVALIGNFDADGACSIAVAYSAFKAMGMNIRYYVPDRKRHGFGLGPGIVDEAFADFEPDLILTVDNGTSACVGVAHANALGAEVVITDHQLPVGDLPDAVAIVNPTLPQSTFPGKSLCGAGVAFYVVASVRALARGFKHPAGDFEILWLLDLVATATVADVVPLDETNRCLVDGGLRIIRSGLARPGIQALFHVADRSMGDAIASDMGFAIGPQLHAAGWIGDIRQAIECLLTEDMEHAQELARELDALNTQRKSLELERVEQAMAQVEDNPDRFSVTLFDKDWHEGIVGLLAGRVREKLGVPVIALASAGAWLKGSGHSIPQVHLRDVLDAVQRQKPGVMIGYRGHSQAALLSVDHWNRERFAAAFEEAVREHLGGEHPEPIIYTDGDPGAEGMTLAAAKALEAGGPWGTQFEEPTFDSWFYVQEQRGLGADHLHTRYTLVPKEKMNASGYEIEAVHFHCPPEEAAQAGELVHLAYRMQVNRFRGQERLQLMVVAIGSPVAKTEAA